MLLLFSCSVVSDSLPPHGLQHARLPCASPTPRACSNSCPLSRWCHPTISSSVVPFSSCLQPFPASGSFLMSWLFPSGDQSFSFNISPSSEYSGLISFRIDWFDLLEIQGTLNSILYYCWAVGVFYVICIQVLYQTYDLKITSILQVVFSFY